MAVSYIKLNFIDSKMNKIKTKRTKTVKKNFTEMQQRRANMWYNNAMRKMYESLTAYERLQ